MSSSAFSTPPTKKRIGITGASGLIGSALDVLLTAEGHQVERFVRRPVNPGSNEIEWHPRDRSINIKALEGLDAVVHLAGENIAGRWTPQKKEKIRKSRLEGTQFLCESVARLDQPPKVLVSASALGFYGDRGDEILTEESSSGKSFLAEVCRGWEAAADPARKAGVRVVHPRIGIVLSSRGGALQQMLRPFQLGFGGRIGSGRQYMSWILLEDLVAAIHFAILNESVSGPVNAVAPNPVSNAEFVKVLGKALKRPTIFPLPAFAVHLAFGEMGQELLLNSVRMIPQKLQDLGFQFAHPDLERALRVELGR